MTLVTEDQKERHDFELLKYVYNMKLAVELVLQKQHTLIWFYRLIHWFKTEFM